MLISASVVLSLIGKFLASSPVGDINSFVGYRTKKSMASKSNWKKAQNVSSELMYKIFLVLTFILIPFAIVDILSFMGIFSANIYIGSLIIQAALIVLGLLLIFIFTEKELSVHEGN